MADKDDMVEELKEEVVTYARDYKNMWYYGRFVSMARTNLFSAIKRLEDTGVYDP